MSSFHREHHCPLTHLVDTLLLISYRDLSGTNPESSGYTRSILPQNLIHERIGRFSTVEREGHVSEEPTTQPSDEHGVFVTYRLRAACEARQGTLVCAERIFASRPRGQTAQAHLAQDIGNVGRARASFSGVQSPAAGSETRGVAVRSAPKLCEMFASRQIRYP